MKSYKSIAGLSAFRWLMRRKTELKSVIIYRSILFSLNIVPPLFLTFFYWTGEEEAALRWQNKHTWNQMETSYGSRIATCQCLQYWASAEVKKGIDHLLHQRLSGFKIIHVKAYRKKFISKDIVTKIMCRIEHTRCWWSVLIFFLTVNESYGPFHAHIPNKWIKNWEFWSRLSSQAGGSVVPVT